MLPNPATPLPLPSMPTSNSDARGSVPQNPGHNLLGGICLATMVAVASAAQAAPGAPDAISSTPPQSIESQQSDAQAIATLFEQARFWEENRRGDLAISTYQRVLSNDPNNAAAVYNIGRLLILDGRLDDARKYLARLKGLEDPKGYAERLSADIENSQMDAAMLGEARARARKGLTEDAADIYKKLFAGREITGPLAIEYYQTLAGLEDHWDEARAGLEKMVKDEPGNMRAKLALGEILSYRPSTRRDSLRLLVEVSKDKDYSAQALDSLKNALLWLDGSEEDMEAFDFYLSKRPNDREVAQKYSVAMAPYDPKSPARSKATAFRLLRQNKVTEAEEEFNKLLADDSKDADLYAGLGIVRLRQEKFAEAENLIERAIKIDPKLAKNYKAALNSAEFWGTFRNASLLVEKGDLDQARAALARLKPSAPDDQREVDLLSATLAFKDHDYRRAVTIYRRVLDNNPHNDRAVAGLVDLYIQTGDFRALSDFHDELAAAGGAQGLSTQGAAAFWRATAHLEERKHRYDNAAAAFRQAIQADSGSPWMRLEFATFYVDRGQTAGADNVMATITSKANPTPDEAYASAIYYERLKNWPRGIAALTGIPLDERTADMKGEMTRLRFLRDVSAAVQRGLVGDRSGAARQLLALNNDGPALADKTALIAAAFEQMQDYDPAVRLIRQDLSNGVAMTPDVGLTYGRILIGAEQFGAAQTVLDQISARPDGLTARQGDDLTALQNAFFLKAGLAAMAKLDYPRAYSYLSAAHKAQPKNAAILRALGEWGDKTNRDGEALTYYRAALDVNPKDMDAVRGAVGAALRGDKIPVAVDVLDHALDKMPRNPELYELVADVARAKGDVRMAVDALARARELRRRPGPQGSAVQVHPSAKFAPARAIAAAREGAMTAAVYRPEVDGPVFITASAKESGSDGLTTQDLLSGQGLSDDLNAEIDSLRDAPKASAKAPARSASGSAVVQFGSHSSELTIDADMLVDLAEAYLAKGRYAQAEKSMTVLDGAQLSDSLRHRADAVLYKSAMTLAKAAVDAKALDAARPHLAILAGHFPKDTPVLLLFARSAEMTGDHDKAAGFYLSALQVKPDALEAYLGAGANYLESGKTAEAGKLVSTGLEKFPSSVALNYLNGKVAKADGRKRDALASFIKAKELLASAKAPATAEPKSVIGSADDTKLSRIAPAAGGSAEEPVDQPDPSAFARDLEDPDTAPPAASSSALDSLRDHLYPRDGDQMAQAETADGDTSSSAQSLRDRLRSLGDDEPARSAPDNRQKPAPSRYADRAPRPSNPSPRYRNSGASDVDWQLAELQAQINPFLKQGFQIRWRSGDAGMSELFEAKAPFAFNVSPTAGRLQFQIEPVFLNAGTIGPDPFKIRYFGTLALVPEASRTEPTNVDSAGGVGFDLNYTVGGFTAQVGVTPLGFETTDITGKLSFSHSFDSGFNFGLSAARQPVTDSILSYAGLKDPVTGLVMGGVMANTMTLHLGIDAPEFGFYVDAKYGIYDGHNVQQNEGLEANSGFYLTVFDDDESSLQTGFNITYLTFQHNQRYFTFGQGGYFSPHQFISASLPLDYKSTSDRLNLVIGGAIGVQHYTEEATVFFPTRPDLQIALSAFELLQPNVFDKASKTSLTGRANASVDYKLTPSLIVGGGLRVERTSGWTEATANFGLTYRFGIVP